MYFSSKKQIANIMASLYDWAVGTSYIFLLMGWEQMDDSDNTVRNGFVGSTYLRTTVSYSLYLLDAMSNAACTVSLAGLIDPSTIHSRESARNELAFARLEKIKRYFGGGSSGRRSALMISAGVAGCIQNEEPTEVLLM